MKYLTLIPALVLSSVVALQFGNVAACTVAHPDHSDQPEQPDYPSNPDHPDSSSAAADQAKALFEKVHAAYKGAAAMSIVRRNRDRGCGEFPTLARIDRFCAGEGSENRLEKYLYSPRICPESSAIQLLVG